MRLMPGHDMSFGCDLVREQRRQDAYLAGYGLCVNAQGRVLVVGNDNAGASFAGFRVDADDPFTVRLEVDDLAAWALFLPRYAEELGLSADWSDYRQAISQLHEAARALLPRLAELTARAVEWKQMTGSGQLP